MTNFNTEKKTKMKQITKPKFTFITLTAIAFLSANAQKMAVNTNPVLQSVQVQAQHPQLSKVPENELFPTNFGGAGKTAVVNCSDKINYVGNTTGYTVKVGGQSYY